MIRLRGSSANAAKPELARILCSASIKENCIKNAPSYMVQSVRPVSTASPFCTFTDVTVPSCGAQISFSLFIASRMNNTSPAFTAWPAAQRTSRIVPGIGAETASPAGAAGEGAGAAAGAGAGDGAAAGAGAGLAAGAFPTSTALAVPFSTST